MELCLITSWDNLVCFCPYAILFHANDGATLAKQKLPLICFGPFGLRVFPGVLVPCLCRRCFCFVFPIHFRNACSLLRRLLLSSAFNSLPFPCIPLCFILFVAGFASFPFLSFSFSFHSFLSTILFPSFPSLCDLYLFIPSIFFFFYSLLSYPFFPQFLSISIYCLLFPISFCLSFSFSLLFPPFSQSLSPFSSVPCRFLFPFSFSSF